MAAGSAHFASTSQIKPSIFDLDAQNDLKGLLKPIAKNLVQWLGIKFPQFSVLLNHPNSLTLVASLMIESYYLQKYGGTFSETFYGLKRVDKENNELNESTVRKSLATEEVLPFLLNGLNNISENYSYGSYSNLDLAKAMIKLNTTLQVGFQLACFLQKLRYITGQTEYHSPLLWLSGLKLAYSEPVDESFSWRTFLPNALQRSFEIGVFLLQCYHWFQTESHGMVGNLPSPPAPQKYQTQNYDGICPICLKHREIDTVLSVSGFVFCFACIQNAVTRNQKCPVTQLPATLNDLIRVYPDDAS